MLFLFFIFNVNVKAKRYKITSYFGKIRLLPVWNTCSRKMHEEGSHDDRIYVLGTIPALNVNIWNNHALINLFMLHIPCLTPHDCWQGVALGELRSVC